MSDTIEAVGARLGQVVSRQQARSRAWLGMLVASLLISVLLAACGEEATPIPPTPTPLPRFQLETNFEQLFTMNIPYGWTKNPVDSTSVLYQSPAATTDKVGVVSRQVDRLTPESQTLLVERTNSLKSRFPGLKEEAGSDTIVLVDSNTKVNRLTYIENGTETIQLLLQFNNVKAERSYLVFGLMAAKGADKSIPLYLDSFRSFTSTATERAGGNAALADPTVIAGQLGGKVVLRTGQEVKGRYLTLVGWQTPPLDLNKKVPIVTGYFPKDYKWRLSPFPTNEQPGIYLESPIIDSTTAQAVIQLGVYKDKLPAGTATADDWKKFYDPILITLRTKYLPSYGPTVKLDPDPVAAITGPNSTTYYRSSFTVRNDDGSVKSRGVILFSRSGSHGVVSVLSLSPIASLSQNLVDSFDLDMQTMANNFQVRF